MARLGFRPLKAVALGVVLLAACSSSDPLTSSTESIDSVVPTSVTTPATSAPATSAVAATTTTSSTAPSTTTTSVPATTTPTTAEATTVPATDAGATTIVPTPVPGPSPETAFVTDDATLREVDVATGAPARAVAGEFGGNGVFRGDLQVSPDRMTIWFGETYEEGFFACDSSVGSIGRVRVADGAVEIIAAGWNPDPSPDGSSVAYISSQQCRPDPENPDFGVVTPGDRVIVRDLATDSVREFVSSSPPDTYGAPGAVEWIGFAPDGSLLVLVGDGRLFAVDVDGPGVIQDHPVDLPAVLGFPVGVTATDVLTIDVGDEGSSDLYAVDRGEAGERFLASAEAFLSIGVSVDGHVLAASSTAIDIADGAVLTVLESGDAFFFDIDW